MGSEKSPQRRLVCPMNKFVGCFFKHFKCNFYLVFKWIFYSITQKHEKVNGCSLPILAFLPYFSPKLHFPEDPWRKVWPHTYGPISDLWQECWVGIWEAYCKGKDFSTLLCPARGPDGRTWKMVTT